MKKVIIESPYQGDIKRNKAYLNDCINDCLMNHEESPYASHGLLTDALDDDNVTERTYGIAAGFEWHKVADAMVVYTDNGISTGMKHGIAHAMSINLTVEYRSLYD